MAYLEWSRCHPENVFLILDLECYQTWSTKKQREVCENCFGNWTVLPNGSGTVYKRRVTNSWPRMELASLRKSLPQSWSGMLPDLVHQKTRRRVWKLFRKRDCLAVLNRSWTVCKRWVTNSWPRMDSASPRKSLPHSWPAMLRLGPPKNKEKCVKTVLETGLSCRTDLELCTREGWLIADLEWSWLHPENLFLSLDLGCSQTWSTKKQRERISFFPFPYLRSEEFIFFHHQPIFKL